MRSNKLKLLLLPFLLLSSCNTKETGKYSLYIKAKEIVTNAETVNIFVGSTFELKVDVKPATFTSKEVKFVSSNDKIAAVSDNGIIKGKSKGSCEITVIAGDEDECQKVIIVNVEKEDRNRQKNGTMLINAKLNLDELAGSTSVYEYGGLSFNETVLAPLTNTYNTNDDGYPDLAEKIKILNDVNYYGKIENETTDERNDRIYTNMKYLFVTSFLFNRLLKTINSSDAWQYNNYHNDIAKHFLSIYTAKNDIFGGLGSLFGKDLTTTIKETPEQHDIYYVNTNYFANAKTQVYSKTNTSCKYYTSQENNLDSSDIISSFMPLINFVNVNSIKQNVTKENTDKLVQALKTYFDTMPSIDTPYYQILKVFINSLDEDSYQISTNDITNEEKAVLGNREATTIKLELTPKGLQDTKTAIESFVKEKIGSSSASDDVLLKEYIESIEFREANIEVVVFDRDQGSGVDIYKVKSMFSFAKKNSDDLQYIRSNVTYDLVEKEMPLTFFVEENERQESYKESASQV